MLFSPPFRHFALLLACLAFGSALAAENSRIVMIHAGFGSGGATAGQSVQLQLITEPFSAAPLTSTAAELPPGQFAPATDAAGLITQARLRDAILGREAVLDPIALDFAGNRDGTINVADLVALVARLIV